MLLLLDLNLKSMESDLEKLKEGSDMITFVCEKNPFHSSVEGLMWFPDLS